MAQLLLKRGFSSKVQQKSPNVYLRSGVFSLIFCFFGSFFVSEFNIILGQTMPMVALGTWKANPGVTQTAVETAIKAGYTNIDCANDYNNEPEVGDAFTNVFKQGIVKREDLFIQAKLWNSNHKPEHVKPDLMQTLIDLKIDYLDSFVIHWPQVYLILVSL